MAEEERLAFPEKYPPSASHARGDTWTFTTRTWPPGSSRGVIKLQAFRAIRRRIDEPTAAARVLCGDFNTLQAEGSMSVTTWASSGPERFVEWDAAERSILEHPTLRDVYRERHAPGEPFPVSH